MEVLVASTVSKLMASTVTYPHEVLRTRLQDQHTPKLSMTAGASASASANASASSSSACAGSAQAPHLYKGLLDCLRQVVRDEGVTGLYRGLSVNIVRAAPACAITFVCFEHMRHALERQALSFATADHDG